MAAKVDYHEFPQFIVSITTNCGGVLSAVFSIICVVTNTELDPSLRSILLSFSIANAMGTAMLSYDTVTSIYYHAQQTRYIMPISVILSVTHLMLLLLAEYIVLTASRKRLAKDFIGLIVISWIISIIIGMMIMDSPTSHVIFAVILILMCPPFAAAYAILTRKDTKKRDLQRAYRDTFLTRNVRVVRKVIVTKCWLSLLRSMLISYACCSAFWVVNELREGLQMGDHHSDIHSASLIIYSFNFYFPSAVCMYMGYQQCMSKKNQTLRRVQLSYRFRDIHLLHI